MMRLICVGAVLLVMIGGDSRLWAQAARAEGNRLFETKIRPILIGHCYECHSTEAGRAKGGLKVDSREALLRGGDSGPAVVAKSPGDSLLYQALLYHEDGSQMPPKGKLASSIVDDFRRWILLGAPDPRVHKIASDIATEIDVEAGRKFWAYQPFANVTDGKTKSLTAPSSIDQWVNRKLAVQGLHPVERAAPEILVRRLFLVLTGLPPSPEEVGRWTSKIHQAASDVDRQQSIASLVDQLLASERYGERWGRHWLDVARYAESTGGDHNNVYQHAWRYRDYVIDAFNDDKPFDQFIREQIAGDLLPIGNEREWADNIIATGFLAMGVKSVGEEDQQKFFADLVDEQIDTTTRAFLATTVACARCHDHKFDPIPQSDYYAMAGVFRSTETHYGLLKAQARQATTVIDLTGMGPPPGIPQLDEGEYAALVKRRDDAAKAIEDAMKKIRSGENVFRGLLRKLRSDRDETEAALQAYSNRGQPRVFAMGTQDRDAVLPTRLLVRGELDQPAQFVDRGVLQVLSPVGKHTLDRLVKEPGFRRHRTDGLPNLGHRSRSGRLELAEWIASSENPLTARVIVNRVWHWMFGRGLVRTVDDFGRAGDMPSHPELLDELAIGFVENNWSIKGLIREIALSGTWQRASNYDQKNFEKDPENQFLWRMNKRRLESEAIRDAMLAASGMLDLNRPLGTYLREVGEGGVGQNVFEPVIRAIDANTRSVFLPRVRSVLPEMLETFDAPDASLVTGSRDSTSSPLQSLYLMNNQFVQDQAITLAERLDDLPRDEQVTQAYERILSRKPRDQERQLAKDYLERFSAKDSGNEQPLKRFRRGGFGDRTSSGMGRGRGRFSRQNPEATDDMLEEGPTPMSPLAIYCQALLSCAEFQTID